MTSTTDLIRRLRLMFSIADDNEAQTAIEAADKLEAIVKAWNAFEPSKEFGTALPEFMDLRRAIKGDEP